MTPSTLERQLAFLKEIDRLKSIVRLSPLIDRSRRENSAEHSWHLAMYALVLAEHATGTVDVQRVVKMLLIHDIVEIDAGDVPFHMPATHVGQDEREAGLRAILNFGHTFGHAIESGLGYGEWLHGEGVGCGMVMAAHLSQRLGLVDMAFVQRLTTLIAQAGLPVRGPVLDNTDNAGRYLSLMRLDKKSEAGEIKFVLIDGPGRAAMRGAPDALVREVIDLCCAP